jgi:hypothetical protein
MARKMTSSYGTTVNVVEHVMTTNMWEFFITDDNHNEDVVRAVVVGFETELGDVSLSEIKPHVISRETEDLAGLMPAPGWAWEGSEA